MAAFSEYVLGIMEQKSLRDNEWRSCPYIATLLLASEKAAWVASINTVATCLEKSSKSSGVMSDELKKIVGSYLDPRLTTFSAKALSQLAAIKRRRDQLAIDAWTEQAVDKLLAQAQRKAMEGFTSTSFSLDVLNKKVGTPPGARWMRPEDLKASALVKSRLMALGYHVHITMPSTASSRRLERGHYVINGEHVPHPQTYNSHPDIPNNVLQIHTDGGLLDWDTVGGWETTVQGSLKLSWGDLPPEHAPPSAAFTACPTKNRTVSTASHVGSGAVGGLDANATTQQASPSNSSRGSINVSSLLRGPFKP